MNERAGSAYVDPFRRALAARLGLRFDDDRNDVLGRILQERIAARGDRSADAYLARLSAGDVQEVRALAQRLTVGETYFFRNVNDLRAFGDAVLPARVRARSAERRLRFLSVGCSSGEEPYTLAMLIRDVPQLAGWDVRIHAFDVNPTAVARARAGRYSAWSLRQTADELRARFFEPDGRDFHVVDDVRALVTFEERNLVDEDARLFAPGAWDVVFCRNVLMYLDPEVARRAVDRIAVALAPGGFLFIGHAETLRGVSTSFHLRQTHGAFYYQSRAPGNVREPLDEPAAESPSPAIPDADWIRAIQASADRIAALARGSAEPDADAAGRERIGATGGDASERAARAAPAPGPFSPTEGPGAVAGALELLKRERFGDALALLGPPTPAEERDIDALLLRAVLLLGSGDVAGADAACERILRVDELNAEAHYLRALCRDHGGDGRAAADHDRYALYLDPTFAMPRLHLGLLARRAGDAAAARRELSRALVLLVAEDGSRILLLGGGFSREALVDLCRAELRACGARP